MTAANATRTFWGFLWWIKHNPYKSIDAMNEDDLDAMILAFRTENPDSVTEADPGGTYTNVTFPKTDTVAGSGIVAVQTVAACEQSHYPEQHKSGG